ncbi:hypothetical protein MAPG_10527 [Magnaporthiopsis poae ATCC 64411]|uniref:Tyrosinase copper-binding domain-containing protein n=1 Tax=Magnaporthiopsis poae (strain ATCC 64411 / 73-15) TaxID=644358 RepID=A0A0C4ECU2_MAGP6|nr:hypothetical protein MAPG_10527 [Magnaporthiopsis poae ATCC 64411]
MHIASFLFPSLAAAAVARRQGGGDSGSSCRNLQKRAEFRTLDAAVQKQYTDAVLCMTKKPSELGKGLNTTLYDDFTYIHTHLNKEIHYVAQFLPWHRYFVLLYENQVRKCGYTGPMPFWDWTLDVADVPRSPIFDPVKGFGGNGRVSGRLESRELNNCVKDGPFKDMQVHYVGTNYNPHCLSRNFNNGYQWPGDMMSSAYSPEAVAKVDKLSNYNDFRIQLESGPHSAIHASIGGDMSPSSSPNDPLFFMHHAQIDRLWYLWQQADVVARTRDYSGDKTFTELAGNDTSVDRPTPPPAALDDVMPFMGMAPDLKVSEVMSTKAGPLCYEY